MRIRVLSTATPAAPPRQTVVKAGGRPINADTDLDEEDAPDTEDSRTLKVFDLLAAFLAMVPEPSDEQIHALATLAGLDPKVFEETLYRLMGVIQEETDEDDGEDLRERLETLLEDGEEKGGDEDLDEGNDEGDDEELDAAAEDRPDEDTLSDDVDEMEQRAGLFTASDAFGEAAEDDGIPDFEALGIPDDLKDAMESDGEPEDTL